MSLPSPLQFDDIEGAICATLSALSRHGLEGCLIGSAAAYFYGMRYRVPKDIDVVVLNPIVEQTSQDIKVLIAQSDERFSLVPSRVPGASHQILWFSLPDPVDVGDRRANVLPTKTRSKMSASRSQSEFKRNSLRMDSSPTRLCKVDILVPSTYFCVEILDSAALITHNCHSAFASYWNSTTQSVQSQHTMQTVKHIPFLTLILLKLAAWNDCSAPEASQKHEQDIEQLIQIVIEENGRGGTLTLGGSPIGGLDWRLGSFPSVYEARRCIAKYLKKWPNTTIAWFTVLKALN